MSTHLPLSIVLIGLIGAAGEAFAQMTTPSTATALVRQASSGAGRIVGTVFDEGGAAVGGVEVLAIGTTMAAARSDSRGRFHLLLPAGQYLLRATRDGFVSTYREPVRVQANVRLERRIQLTRSATAPSSPAEQGPVAGVEPAEVLDSHAHSDLAWRLRHLRRTVLRDESHEVVMEESGPPFAGAPAALRGSLVDWALEGTAHAATSFWSHTDLTGQINLLSATSMLSVARPMPTAWTHGIADVILGAPAGGSGAWSVRGAIAAGDASSWTLVGDYETVTEQHDVRLVVSYSTQALMAGREQLLPVVPESRSVGGVQAADRWRVDPSLEIAYGLRFDRYDYLLTRPNLFSPHVGVRAGIASGYFLTVAASQSMVAPGADQFRPPSASGPWLPPSRTFSSLAPGRELRPEQVRQQTVGFERVFGADGARLVAVEVFSQSTLNQLATLFGLDRTSEVGHYYVASTGNVDVVGWRVRLAGEVSRHVNGSVEYASGRAEWRDTLVAGAVRRQAPSMARRGSERVSDLRASVDVLVPQTATEVMLGYRLNGARPDVETATVPAITDGGFNLELRQRLPYRPLESGKLTLLFTLTTLLYNEQSASIYDELLTLHAPVRMTGGIRVGF